ncbi:MAG: N-acetyltransferase [Rhodospirillales bacterium]|nr:N-acetyltransferase [Rhodospirillales bacterium]
MAEPFRIRDATEADIPSITAIYRWEVESGVATFEEVAPSEQDMLGRMTAIKRLALPYLVAERTDGILGYAYAGLFHPRAAYRYTLEDTVYIRLDGRRLGVARALLVELIARCEAIGCRQMMALITYSTDNASVALHTALGFRSMGVAQAVGFKLGRWLDVAYMQRPIGAADSISPDRPVLGLPSPQRNNDA